MQESIPEKKNLDPMRSIRLIKGVVVELMKQDGEEKEGRNQNGNRDEEEWTRPEEG